MLHRVQIFPKRWSTSDSVMTLIELVARVYLRSILYRRDIRRQKWHHRLFFSVVLEYLQRCHESGRISGLSTFRKHFLQARYTLSEMWRYILILFAALKYLQRCHEVSIFSSLRCILCRLNSCYGKLTSCPDFTRWAGVPPTVSGN